MRFFPFIFSLMSDIINVNCGEHIMKKAVISVSIEKRGYPEIPIHLLLPVVRVYDVYS